MLIYLGEQMDGGWIRSSVQGSLDFTPNRSPRQSAVSLIHIWQQIRIFACSHLHELTSVCACIKLGARAKKAWKEIRLVIGHFMSLQKNWNVWLGLAGVFCTCQSAAKSDCYPAGLGAWGGSGFLCQRALTEILLLVMGGGILSASDCLSSVQSRKLDLWTWHTSRPAH